MQLSVRDRWIEGPSIRIKGEYPVLHAHLIGERVVVIYDWIAFPRDRPARNLYCYDMAGSLLWRAPDIEFGSTDAYTTVQSESPLWVGNFACVDCRIDEASGQVLEQVFTK